MADDTRTGAIATGEQLAGLGQHGDGAADGGGEAGHLEAGGLAGAAADLVLGEGEGRGNVVGPVHEGAVGPLFRGPRAHDGITDSRNIAGTDGTTKELDQPICIRDG